MDHRSVDWAEVATAVNYLDHIVEGRAIDLAEAAQVEHERFVSEDAANRLGEALG